MVGTRPKTGAAKVRRETSRDDDDPSPGGSDAAAARALLPRRPNGADFSSSQSIGLLMRIALFGLRAAFKGTLARYKLPWRAWYYLRVLYETDGITQQELTERVGTMQPNTVSALRNLVRSGLVKVERSAADRRSTVVRLTPKARRLMQRLLPEVLATTRPVLLDGFSDREVRELLRLLNKMCDNVRRTPRPAKARL
jgi:MarR family transcriptional regulator, organic hydroperoxide resistance regulator